MLLPEAIANHVNISWAASHNVLITNPGWFENCRLIADMALAQIWSGFPLPREMGKMETNVAGGLRIADIGLLYRSWSHPLMLTVPRALRVKLGATCYRSGISFHFYSVQVKKTYEGN